MAMTPQSTTSRARSKPARDKESVATSPFPRGTIRTTKILTDTEVAFILRRILETLPPDWRVVIIRDPTGLEAQVRFGSVAARCRAGRALRRISLKEAAAGARLPQYRVKAIETSRLNEVQTDALHCYIQFLGLQSWFTRWRRANPAVVTLLAAR
jgi:hypothetical protein